MAEIDSIYYYYGNRTIYGAEKITTTYNRESAPWSGETYAPQGPQDCLMFSLRELSEAFRILNNKIKALKQRIDKLERQQSLQERLDRLEQQIQNLTEYVLKL